MKIRLPKKLHSLKFKLMILITFILFLVVGLPVSFFVYHLDKNYEEFSINMIETTSQVVYQFIYNAMMENDSTALQENLEVLGMDPIIKIVRLMRPTGKILYSSRTEEINRNLQDFIQDISFLEEDKRYFESFSKTDNIYSHHHPVYVQKECTPCHANEGSLIAILDVHAGFTSSKQIYITSKNLAVFGGLSIIIILWILLNLLYQSQVESRLQSIISGFQKLSEGDFNLKLKIPGRDELSHLAEKFNHMTESLKFARQKEDQFLQEKLERADRLVTLGEVAAEIAHEVNNPAGIILTRAEYLKDEMQEKNVDSTCVDDLNIIIQQTEKIAETTRSILHFSRKLPQSFKETDLPELIKHSIKILEPRLKKNKIQIELNLPNQPIKIWGNYNQLEQVFCNLMNNSLDFIQPEKGKITISINHDKNQKKSDKLVIIFEDNGPGISEENQNQIFNPFFTTKDSTKGTGLGLFIAKNILSHHNGIIILDQNNKGGARFIIELDAYNG